ncbi:hypothetical protein, partial [Streptomyces sindenensis]|uniref:hypothetical protein n=1 Tax=Streptomyces sindenensis TaxID=67363 RepID=UPI001E4E1077
KPTTNTNTNTNNPTNNPTNKTTQVRRRRSQPGCAGRTRRARPVIAVEPAGSTGQLSGSGGAARS